MKLRTRLNDLSANRSHAISRPATRPVGTRIMMSAIMLAGIDITVAGQPTDVVTSDGSANTAMGSNALLNLSSGFGNTATGFDALLSTTGGSYNTATGQKALVSNTTGGANTATGYGALYFNATGVSNTGTGYHALLNNVSGNNNTATGYQALFNNTAHDNTADGYNALLLNTSGFNNTATGSSALSANVDGGDNSAFGALALSQNTNGVGNTASGAFALYLNHTGQDNTADGVGALNNNNDGDDNTAVGSSALNANTSGAYNTATGFGALVGNTVGVDNTASGWYSLAANSSGAENTGIGFEALYHSTGSNNIALGFEAGLSIASGSYNIDIGSAGAGTDGVNAKSGVIRIGTAGAQNEVFIAGIENSKITGSAVYVTSTGRLGVLASSERYKTAIAPMGANTAKLAQLRPVSFKLKTDAEGTVQYGLIAEEVDKVYPELVIRDEAGTIQGVRYDELAPMLLNEFQSLVRQRDADAVIRDSQSAKIALLEQKLAEVDDLKQQLSSVIQELKTGAKLVAQR